MTLPREPRFVSIEAVFRLHAYAIEDQGGDPSIRDRGLLESALAMPRQQFGGEYLHPTIPAMAAAYAFHICKNHPFIDGNKRAATAAMIKFLSDNDWSFDATADEAEPVILDLAAGKLSKDQITSWLEKHCHEKPSMELREFFASLDWAVFGDYLSAFIAGQAKESKATIVEAKRVIPLIESLTQTAEGVDTHSLSVMAMTLTALFRIAEDMGYEW